LTVITDTRSFSHTQG